MEGNLVNLALANKETVPENRADIGLDPIPEGHVNTKTVPALGNRIHEVTLILENHIDKEIVCI